MLLDREEGARPLLDSGRAVDASRRMVYGRDASSLLPSDGIVHPLRRGGWRVGCRCRWSPGGATGVAAFSAFVGAVSGARSTAGLTAALPLDVNNTARSTASTSRALREPFATANGLAAIASDAGLVA